MIKLNAQSITQATNATALSVETGIPNVGHISCDGIASSDLLRVFAWGVTSSGSVGDQGWNYQFNGNPIHPPHFNFMSANTSVPVENPEVALVSGFGKTYAIIVYEDPLQGLTYEAYLWNGAGAFGLYANASIASHRAGRTFNVSGNKYGTFSITWDEANTTSTTISQLSGYIDHTGTGFLLFGPTGSIQLISQHEIWQPDVALTYENVGPLGSGSDAMDFFTFIDVNLNSVITVPIKHGAPC